MLFRSLYQLLVCSCKNPKRSISEGFSSCPVLIFFFAAVWEDVTLLTFSKPETISKRSSRSASNSLHSSASSLSLSNETWFTFPLDKHHQLFKAFFCCLLSNTLNSKHKFPIRIFNLAQVHNKGFPSLAMLSKCSREGMLYS